MNKKIAIGLLLGLCSATVLTGCDYDQTPDEYMEKTVDPALQEMAEPSE